MIKRRLKELRLALPLALLLLAACTQANTTPVAVEEQVVIVKQLATVPIPPTPNAAQRQATQIASGPTATIFAPTTVPSATPYVGVFLGEAAIAANDPIINPALFGDILPVETGAPGPQLACPFAPNETFGTAWQDEQAARQALGCATEQLITFEGTLQVFERGVMYFRPTGEIWAVAPGGALPGTFWFAEQVPAFTQTDFSAPAGLRVPVLGFGAMWSVTPGVRDSLGFAQTDEQTVAIALQRFEGGTLIRDNSSGQVFVLAGRSTAYGPFS